MEFGDDMVDCKLLLENVGWDSGVGDFRWEPIFDPNDRTIDGFDVGFAAFDDAHGLAVEIIVAHND